MYQSYYPSPALLQQMTTYLEHTVSARTIEEAEDSFVDAKEKLLDINHWKNFADVKDATFCLTDSHGNTIRRRAHKGDRIRFDVAGPAGSTVYWASIERLEYDDYPDLVLETFSMHLRPLANPLYKGVNASDEELTCVVVIERQGAKLYADYHVRMEDAHNTGTSSADTWLGLSGSQWDSLIEGFIKPY
jgi:hypothetical protein